MRIPTATYRIQFNPFFGFEAARKIVPYLAELGISDIYASPIFKAKKGSLHGYDVVDPNQLNPDLGAPLDFEALSKELENYSMGWLQDIVPNHMAFDYENAMLMDVLENGQSSRYFNFFDIDWDHPYESIKGRVLAPFLGRFYGESLEDGEIRLNYGADGLTINYRDLAFSLKLDSYTQVFARRLSELKRRLGGGHPDFIRLLGVLFVLKSLPSRDEAEERYEQIKFIKGTLWDLYQKNPHINKFIDENVRFFNGEIGNPDSFKLLDDLLSEQLFRLAFWKVATEEINYRRFFNINELISLKAEDEDVFRHTHSRIFDLIKEGKLTGLRIDHIDGLYDPTTYLEWVRERQEKTYVVVEKILDLGEDLPSFWPVQGTTGYDFMNFLNGVFCKNENERGFDRLYTTISGSKTPYVDLVCEKKRLIIGKHMAGDIDNLAHLLKRISSAHRYGSDITLYGLKRALVEMMAHFPVYRTYVNKWTVRETDLSYISGAVNSAIHTNPGLQNELHFIERFLVPHLDDPVSEGEKEQRAHFVMRFQQFTGPLMAKGFEDTVLYVYNRLLSLNEVGGSPNNFGISLREFQNFNKRRSQRWPHSLSTTSTHDAKRGEDVRARINVLSEIPKEWESNFRTWSRINRKSKIKVKDLSVPDSNDEYFLYQTVIGAYPFSQKEYPEFLERMKNYVIKAVREAKIHTAWLKPDTEYEDAYLSFVEKILDPSRENPFLREFLQFQKKISYYGIFNSLAQTLIKITCPGVPDFYQGTELWDLNLVDPDNRRPVNFQERTAFLREIRRRSEDDILKFIEELFSTKEDGRIKLFLVYRALKARNEHLQLFQDGTYMPLEVAGKSKDNVVAFVRSHEGMWAVTVAPRLLTGLIKEGEYPLGHRVWNDTCIPLPEIAPRSWRDVLTDQYVKSENPALVAEILRFFPVSLLISESPG